MNGINVMGRMNRFIVAVASAAVLSITSFANAGMVSFTTPAVAVQHVDLFVGTPFQVDTTLTAVGSVTWNLDVDVNGNTINNDSFITSDFIGVLPAAFAPLGLSGVPFDLFSLLGGQTVTATNNGTTVTVDTTFGLTVPAVGVSFFTSTPSEFIASVSGVPFTSFVAHSPAPAAIFIGDNPLGIPQGSLVGDSFSRVVSSVPEPSSAALLGLGGVGVLIAALRRRIGSR